MRVAAFQITKMHKKQYRFAAIDFGHTKNLRFEDRNGGFLDNCHKSFSDFRFSFNGLRVSHENFA